MLGLPVRRVFLRAKKLHSVAPSRSGFPDSRQVMPRSRGGLLIFGRRGHFLVPTVNVLLLVSRARSARIRRRKGRPRSILSTRRKGKHRCSEYNRWYCQVL